MNNQFLYDPKPTVLTKTEQNFMAAINKALPENCILLVQQNLGAIVERTDNSRFRNELFRIVDFLIVDQNYKPLIAIEINDQTHEDYKRKSRDIKVYHILEEAGIPLVTFWTRYGINQDYITKKISETYSSLPIERKHHFNQDNNDKINRSETKDIYDNRAISSEQNKSAPSEDFFYITSKKKGCYIATCIYNSYDCPEVWTLRRFRDNYLENSAPGRLFIKCYYAISPKIVDVFGDFNLFRIPCKVALDRFVKFLNRKGFRDDRYED